MADNIGFNEITNDAIKLEEALKRISSQLVTINNELKTLRSQPIMKEGSGKEAKELHENTKKINEATKKAIELKKEQQKAALELDKQRQRGLAIMAKQEAQQRELIAASKMEIKSEDDLIKRNNALVKLRRLADRTTEEGRQSIKKMTAEIKNNTESLKKMDSQISRNYRNVGNYAKGFVKGFMNMVGALGLAVGAAALFKKGLDTAKQAISSIQTTADKFDIVLQGLKEGYNSFLRSLANGTSFKDLIKNFKDAYSVGKEYSRILDDLGDRQRSLKIIEADYESRQIELIKISKDVLKSNQDRIAAIDEFVQNEMFLEEERVKNAEQAYKADLLIAQERSHLTREEIEDYLRRYDAYVDFGLKMQEQAKTIEGSTSTIYVPKAGEEAMVKTLFNINQLDDAIRDKLVNAYVLLIQAQNSAELNSQKLEAKRSMLIEENVKNEEKAVDTSIAEQEKLSEEIFKNLLARKQAEKDAYIEAEKNHQAYLDEKLKNEQEQAAKEKEIAEKLAEEKKQVEQEITDHKISIAQSVGNFMGVLFDNQLLALEEKNKKGLISDEKYAKEAAKIRRKQAILDKADALFQIGVNTAIGVTNAAAKVVTLPLIPFIVGLGALQAAAVLAQKIPEFAKGVVRFKGEGTRKSDSNIVKISKDESVVTATGTDKAPRFLEGLNANDSNPKLIEALQNDGIIEPYNAAILALNSRGKTFDDQRLLLETKKNNELLSMLLKIEKNKIDRLSIYPGGTVREYHPDGKIITLKQK